MIYYGTESGMWGADDPDDRKPMVWQDFKYDDETHHPYDEERPRDTNNLNAELFSYYGQLAEVRNNEPALKYGKAEILHHDSDSKIVLFSRNHEGETIFVLLNRSEKVQAMDLSSFTRNENLRNLLGKESFPANEIQINPLSGLILK